MWFTVVVVERQQCRIFAWRSDWVLKGEGRLVHFQEEPYYCIKDASLSLVQLSCSLPASPSAVIPPYGLHEPSFCALDSNFHPFLTWAVSMRPLLVWEVCSIPSPLLNIRQAVCPSVLSSLPSSSKPIDSTALLMLLRAMLGLPPRIFKLMRRCWVWLWVVAWQSSTNYDYILI